MVDLMAMAVREVIADAADDRCMGGAVEGRLPGTHRVGSGGWRIGSIASPNRRGCPRVPLAEQSSSSSGSGAWTAKPYAAAASSDEAGGGQAVLVDGRFDRATPGRHPAAWRSPLASARRTRSHLGHPG